MLVEASVVRGAEDVSEVVGGADEVEDENEDVDENEYEVDEEVEVVVGVENEDEEDVVLVVLVVEEDDVEVSDVEVDDSEVVEEVRGRLVLEEAEGVEVSTLEAVVGLLSALELVESEELGVADGAAAEEGVVGDGTAPVLVELELDMVK